jgi:hypothetical protein
MKRVHVRHSSRESVRNDQDLDVRQSLELVARGPRLLKRLDEKQFPMSRTRSNVPAGHRQNRRVAAAGAAQDLPKERDDQHKHQIVPAGRDDARLRSLPTGMAELDRQQVARISLDPARKTEPNVPDPNAVSGTLYAARGTSNARSGSGIAVRTNFRSMLIPLPRTHGADHSQSARVKVAI